MARGGVTLRVDWTARAEKEGRKLDKKTRERVLAAIRRLAETGEGDVKPLTGVFAGEWRLAVARRWRVIYRPHAEEGRMEILHVLPRDKAYRVREPMERYGAENLENAA
jgi:mRNA-degrading endonuclease RelE of RelBE toxin-antitoxin system